MKKNTCCILGAGDYFGDEIIPEESFIIAADGGLKFCKKNKITPDVIIGDFDSLGFEAEGENVIKLPVIKDDTDTMAAVKFGLNKGFKTFYIFGGTGGRLSHTVSNLQTLTFIAKNGGKGFLLDKEEVATVTNEGIAFNKKAVGFISVFSAEGEVMLSEEGLKYELDKATIKSDFPLGVSNEFIGKKSKITIHKGTALIIFGKKEIKKTTIAD